MRGCTFCNYKKISNNIIYESINFKFISPIAPIVPGHGLLISNEHIREEHEIEPGQSKEYLYVTSWIIKFITEKYKYSPLIFINPAQQQSVPHFHKHFVPGVFGIGSVDRALQRHLKENNIY